jgi:hypothetical protein
MACAPEPLDDQDYVARIKQQRIEKDQAWQGQPEPIPANRKSELLPLVYFEVDPSYNVPAVFKPSKDRAVLTMPYSDGAMRDVRRTGTLEFTLKGQPFKLTAYTEVASPNEDRLFIPFSDPTSGTETYPAGRYLELDRTATGIYELDFNQAFNPSCYYSPLYSCPIPPKENRLPVAIEAGERIKEKGKS